MKMPKVDIIIPAYNAAKYLPAAIESVITQTFEDWRILLVDDGSTDGTAEIVAPYLERLGPKLKYIYQANMGMSAARNTALRHASAEFLAFLDADDLWLPCRLAESLACFVNRSQVGLVYGFNARVDEQGLVFDTFDRIQSHAEGCIAPYIYMREIDFPCPTITVRKVCVDQVGLFDEELRATEDRDLWLRIALHYEVALVPKVIAHYRTSPASLTTDPERMFYGQRQFIDKHYGAPGCGFLQRRVALSKSYRQRAEALGLRGRKAAALTSALRGVLIYPLLVSNWRTATSLAIRALGLRQ